MFYLVLMAIFIAAAIIGPRILFSADDRHTYLWPLRAGRVVLFVLAAFSASLTSYNYIDKDSTGLYSCVYCTGKLAEGHIIAVNGEAGPQARTLSPGFNFSPFFNIFNSVTQVSTVSVPNGQFGYLVALDGAPLRPGQTFADPFKSGDAIRMVSDAELFLKNGGQRGPQISVLTPGTYRINTLLWNVVFGKITDIPVGTVAVIKSNARAAVDLGNLKADAPADCTPINNAKAELQVPIVPVGCVGIWDKPLQPGSYYINTAVYSLTLVDTKIQTWEYQGGFTKRTIDLKVDEDGKIEQNETSEKITIPDYAADGAIPLKVEGWTVYQQIRVQAQVAPDRAPYVVASVGNLDEVEDRIITPAMQSILPTVAGSTLQLKETVLKADGTPETDADGNSITRLVSRPTRVLDFIENREVIEREVEEDIRSEGAKVGVDIKDVRLLAPDFPPELLLPRKRQQLAGQLIESYKQERLAQLARVDTENAKARADQQAALVTAAIEVERQTQLALARKAEGQGEKDKLVLIAEGQKAQTEILGQDKVVELQKFNSILDKISAFAMANPKVIETGIANASKFVPASIVQVGNDTGNGLGGAAAILGSLLNQGKTEAPKVQP